MVCQRHVGRAYQDRTSADLPLSRSKLSRTRTARAITVVKVSTLSLSIRFPSEYPHLVLEELGWTMPSPSERNAAAKWGSAHPPPIACNLPRCACTLTHAFANSPIRT